MLQLKRKRNWLSPLLAQLPATSPLQSQLTCLWAILYLGDEGGAGIKGKIVLHQLRWGAQLPLTHWYYDLLSLFNKSCSWGMVRGEAETGRGNECNIARSARLTCAEGSISADFVTCQFLHQPLESSCTPACPADIPGHDFLMAQTQSIHHLSHLAGKLVLALSGQTSFIAIRGGID